jgi:hypothetical protein
MWDSICTEYPTQYKCKHLYRGCYAPVQMLFPSPPVRCRSPPPFFCFHFPFFSHLIHSFTNKIYNHKFICMSLISSHSNTNMIYNHKFTRNIWTRGRNIKKNFPRVGTPAGRARQYRAGCYPRHSAPAALDPNPWRKRERGENRKR